MVHGTRALGITDIADSVAKHQTPGVKSGCCVDFPGEGLAYLSPLPIPSVLARTFGLGPSHPAREAGASVEAKIIFWQGGFKNHLESGAR